MPDLRIFMLTKSRLPQFQTTKRVQQASKPASQQASNPLFNCCTKSQKSCYSHFDDYYGSHPCIHEHLVDFRGGGNPKIVCVGVSVCVWWWGVNFLLHF
jgi:hypothetical protein